LCERRRIASGCPAKLGDLKLDCRLDGRDREIEVGKPLPSGEDVVVAMLDHGREKVFDVHTASRGRDVVRVGRHVHAVTELPKRAAPSPRLLSSVMVRAAGSG